MTTTAKSKARAGRRDDGMRLWGRVLLVLVAHLVLLAAVWWSWHPRVGDHNTTPGMYPRTFGMAVACGFLLVLLQVTDKIPFKGLCAMFLLVPFATFFVQYGGYKVWTTTVMQLTSSVTVTQAEHLFNGGYRVRVTGAGTGETVAYSTLGRRTTTGNVFTPIRVGDTMDVITDPTGLAVPMLVPQGWAGSPSSRTSPLWAGVTLVSAVYLELICLSALTRRRSQIMAVDDKGRFGGAKAKRSQHKASAAEDTATENA
ncbi:MAG TPA: hypothetical protein VFM86_00450 [Pedococcus sp.]|nr:hypothetical protein [Pedococcus sp.]